MVTFQEESLINVLPELQEVLKDHWKEFHNIEPNFNWELYKTYANAGILCLVTVRDKTKLVGYHLSFIFPYIHQQDELSAFMDIFFLYPEYRNKHIGKQMFIHAEKIYKEKGVKRIRAGYRLSKPLSNMYSSLGYKEIEITTEKVLP